MKKYLASRSFPTLDALFAELATPEKGVQIFYWPPLKDGQEEVDASEYCMKLIKPKPPLASYYFRFPAKEVSEEIFRPTGVELRQIGAPEDRKFCHVFWGTLSGSTPAMLTVFNDYGDKPNNMFEF
ncbi:MAG TPA: hypothetical protein VMQ44_03885 [Candidatus Saccharimonadales bacterium]|nr:hypothetical protein [Candidatus Saccharimonadales bacterium]